MPRFHTIALANIELRVALEGDGPLVVMVHGFPESWFSWRHQIGPIAAAGFTACALDVRGYGGSGKPRSVAEYDMAHMIDDICGVIEALSPQDRAVLVGHDWGAPMVWNSALTRPDRVRAVAGLSVPYMGVPTRSFREVYEAVFTAKNRFFYQHYFQAEGVAEAELERDVRGFLRRFFYATSGDAADGVWPTNKVVGDDLLTGLVDPDPFPPWLTVGDLDYYVTQFETSGFRGPLNRYRNHDRDFEFLKGFAGRRIEQPALFIGGTRDPAFNLAGRGDPIATMRREMADLRGADLLEDCGHWTQQERPDAVNARLIPWLKGL